MKVFVTGATGFVGTAVLQELFKAGHEVTGLARSDKAADLLNAAGVAVHRGSLEDTDSLRQAAREADGIIHLGFIHDFSNYAAANEIDRLAIEAMGRELEGTGKPIILTSGALMLAPGRIGTEKDEPSPHAIRYAEKAVLALAERGVHASMVRLAPSVHDVGDYGFVPTLIDIARAKGVSAYIGDGSNRWCAVHRLDAAVLFRKALEKAVPGTRLHGVDEGEIPFRDIAEVIGQKLNLPVVSITPDEAANHFGWIHFAASADMPISSTLTREWMDWTPAHHGLIADLEQGHYFTTS
ncbi:SDR family oxidoreductase [Paenibacillus wulumuqiensis]|uniref:SDR family oxidoreductase n=1 Tax=Paenibacillus wulumuqiensis TaxID=1567107 RepID=UPI00061923C2|nr:SDR family oxidoreductase [Paenibacillus wulumuqiensis]